VLHTETWDNLADVLAPSLEFEDWRRVAMVYQRLSRFDWAMRTHPGAPFSVSERSALDDTRQKATEARDLLVTVEPNLD
jgi:hypothetical protein